MQLFFLTSKSSISCSYIYIPLETVSLLDGTLLLTVVKTKGIRSWWSHQPFDVCVLSTTCVRRNARDKGSLYCYVMFISYLVYLIHEHDYIHNIYINLYHVYSVYIYTLYLDICSSWYRWIMMIYIMKCPAGPATRQVHIFWGGTCDGAHGCGPAKLSCGRLRCGKLFGSPTSPARR